jgi:hypothetical protein
MISFTLWTLWPLAKDTLASSEQESGWIQSASGRSRKEKILLFIPEIEPMSLGHPLHNQLNNQVAAYNTVFLEKLTVP